MQSERDAIEHGDVANDALHLDVTASHRCAIAGPRKYGDFAGTVIDLVHLERHARNAPGVNWAEPGPAETLLFSDRIFHAP